MPYRFEEVETVYRPLVTWQGLGIVASPGKIPREGAGSEMELHSAGLNVILGLQQPLAAEGGRSARRDLVAAASDCFLAAYVYDIKATQDEALHHA